MNRSTNTNGGRGEFKKRRAEILDKHRIPLVREKPEQDLTLGEHH